MCLYYTVFQGYMNIYIPSKIYRNTRMDQSCDIPDRLEMNTSA